MPDRVRIADIDARAVELGDRLADRTTELFHATAEPSDRLLISCLLGLRARQSLRAMHLLIPEGLDDQLAVVGRTLAEAVIDLEYLNVASERIMGPRRRRLEVQDKERLFQSSLLLAEERIRGTVTSVPPEVLEEAKVLRRSLGLPEFSPYWHCARGTRAIVLELREALMSPVERGTIENTYHLFQLFSLSTHTNPNHTFYFEDAPGGGWPWTARREFFSDEMASGAVLLGIHAIRLWGERIDHDITPEALELVRALLGDAD